MGTENEGNGWAENCRERYQNTKGIILYIIYYSRETGMYKFYRGTCDRRHGRPVGYALDYFQVTEYILGKHTSAGVSLLLIHCV